MTSRKLLTLSLVALSLAAVTPAMALNPQPEPPNMPQISKMRLGQGMPSLPPPPVAPPRR